MKLDPVSKRYAAVLHAVATIGIVLLFIGFLLYITGAIPSKTSPKTVTTLWHLSADEYVARTGQATGWTWIRGPLSGEEVAFASLVFLALCTIVCLIAIMPLLVRNRDVRYVVIVLVQIVVLLAAATGVAAFA